MGMCRTWILTSLLLAACTSDKIEDSGEEADTDTDTDTDSDTDTDTDTDTDPNAAIRQMSWTLHKDIESLVYVQWTQKDAGPVSIEFRFDDGAWMEAPSMDGVVGENTHLLVGIPYAEEADWQITTGSGEVFLGDTITTGALPDGMPVPEVMVADDTQWIGDGNYFLSSINGSSGGWTGGTYWTYIMDRQGRVMWAQPAPDRHWTLFTQVSVTGDHILWDEATKWSDFDYGEASLVHRIYLDEEIDTLSTPGLHHAFFQLPDETLAWGSKFHDNSEALVEMHPDSPDKIDVLWTCDESWPGVGSYCESNGLFYDPIRDTYLYSFYTNNSLVEVDRTTGTSLWWAGAVVDGYTFSPSDAKFRWQHGISYTEDRTLLVSSEAYVDGSKRTVVWEYAVDHKAQTLTELWMFNPGVHAVTNGDAWRLDNGNTLHVVGSSGHIKEATATGEVVWHVTFNDNHLLGRGEFITDLYTLVSPAFSGAKR